MRARDALRYLSVEVRGLHAAAYILALAALLSSLLALLRDRLFADAFGAGAILDIYYASFRIPDLIFVATGALVSVYILIPELTRRNQEEQKDYIDTIVVGFSIFAVVVAVLAAMLAPYILEKLFPNLWALDHGPTLVLLTRILLLQPILLGLSNIFAGVTQVKERYTLYAISPLLYNGGIIFGVLVLYPAYGIVGLVWGVVLGALLHAAIQLPSLFADGFFHRMPRLRHPRVLLTTASISLPRALALSMNQLTFFGLTAFAGLLATGSIAVFMFAYNLAAVPLAIIGASYSVAAFPTLARALSRGETDAFVGYVATAARYVLFWSIPASALILVLRAHIVRVILGTGAFNWNDTRLTAAAFALIAFALGAQGITLLLVRGYYAAGKTFVPLAVSIIVALSTLAMAAGGLFALTDQTILATMERFLRVDDIPGSNMLMLALAYAVAAILGAIILALHFEWRFRGLLRAILPALLDSVLAASAGGLAAYIVLGFTSTITTLSTVLSIFLQGFTAGLCGMLVAALTYRMLGSKEFAEVYGALRTRIWRTKAAEEITITTSAEGPGTPTSA